MEPTRPEVTTIIPTRDREDWLPRTLVSALGQKDVEGEVIVVDDGSRTPVTSLLGPKGRMRTRVVRHDVPRGPPSARNTGIAEARGRWVALLDDDDIWAPVKLRRQVDVAEETGADFVFCGVVTTDRNGLPLSVMDPPPPDEHLHTALLGLNVVPGGNSSLLVKTDLVKSLGGFDPGLTILSDWDLMVRLSAASRGAMIPEVLVGYTIHQANIHQNDSMLAKELRHFDRKHAEARATSGVSLDRVSWLGWRIDVRRSGGNRMGAAAAFLKLGWLRRDPGLVIRGVTLATGGERAMRVARRVRGRGTPSPGPSAPAWLAQAANPSEASIQAMLG